MYPTFEDERREEERIDGLKLQAHLDAGHEKCFCCDEYFDPEKLDWQVAEIVKDKEGIFRCRERKLCPRCREINENELAIFQDGDPHNHLTQALRELEIEVNTRGGE